MSVVYISEQGAYLRKSAGTYTVTVKDQEIFSVPENVVDRFVILGNVQISTQVISELLEKGTELLFLSRNGKFKGILEPGYPKNIFVRLAQYDCSIDSAFTLEMAKKIVMEKKHSQLEAVGKWVRNGWISSPMKAMETKNYQRYVSAAENRSRLMALEAADAKKYFNIFGKAVPPPFHWQGRNRRPPLDPVNALLSLTYMMVLGEIISACYAHGIDPYIGFLHHLDYGRPSFALDILEQFRASYCEHFVIKILQKEYFIPSDFQFSKNSGCRLNSAPFKKYINLYAESLLNNDTVSPALDKSVKTTAQQYAEIFKNRKFDFDPSTPHKPKKR